MLTRLIYVSQSLQKLPLDLKDILEVSQRNNARDHITGAMTHLDGTYMQYLEGEDEKVDATYSRIVLDKRHQNPRLLQREAIAMRAFKDWSMGLVTWNDQTRAIFKAFNPEEMQDLYAARPEASATFFETLSRSSNWLSAS